MKKHKPRAAPDNVDVEVLEHRDNRDLIAYLRSRATKAEPTEFDIDEWELHTHPDLTDRMVQVVELAGIRPRLVPVFGVPVLVNGKGFAYCFAEGMRSLVLRLNAPSDTVSPHQIPGWYEVDPFDPEIPTDDHLLALSETLVSAIQGGRRGD